MRTGSSRNASVTWRSTLIAQVAPTAERIEMACSSSACLISASSYGIDSEVAPRQVVFQRHVGAVKTVKPR
jgi:hypothetical protein